jgi:ribonuclease P/MRP protein subunit POP5
MVRIKHRYLLVNILYPSSQATQLKVANNNLPDVVQFHQPTSSEFNDELLRRLIRNNVSELFGDYGIGMIAGSLKGTLQVFSVVLHKTAFPLLNHTTFKHIGCSPILSHVLIHSNFDSNHSSVTRMLSACLGCAIVCYAAAQTTEYSLCFPSFACIGHNQKE